MKNLLLKSSSYRFLEVSVEIILSILLTPFLIHNLGDSHYGLWILILSTLGWFKFLDLGFSYAVQRNIVLAIEKLDNLKINTTFSVAVVLFSSLGAIAASSLIVLAFFPSFLGVDESDYSVTTIALCVLALKVLWDFGMTCFHGFFTAYIRLDIPANLSTLNSIIRSIIIYFLIKDYGIYAAVSGIIIADIVSNLLKVYFAKRLNSAFKFNLALVKWSEIMTLFSFSKHIIASSIALSIKGRVDPIIIAHLLSLKMVALYSVIARLTVQLEGLVTGIVGVFDPVFLKLVARNVPVNKVFKQIVSINFFVVIILYTPLAIFSEGFINLWIGDEYSGAADLAFILGFAYICRTIARPINTMLLAQANHKILSIVNLTGAILNIILSIYLGKIWGLMGIAIATGISFFISDVILHLALYKHYSKENILPLFLKFCSICLFYTCLVFIGKYAVSFITLASWIQLIIAATICELIILALTWKLLLPKETRSTLISMFTQRSTTDG